MGLFGSGRARSFQREWGFPDFEAPELPPARVIADPTCYIHQCRLVLRSFGYGDVDYVSKSAAQMGILANRSCVAIAYEKTRFTYEDPGMLAAAWLRADDRPFFTFSLRRYTARMAETAHRYSTLAFSMTGHSGVIQPETLDASVALKFGKTGLDYLAAVKSEESHRAFVEYARRS